MNHATCAACDGPLDGSAIQVTVGGHSVDVCCDACARDLREAHVSAQRGDSSAASGDAGATLDRRAALRRIGGAIGGSILALGLAGGATRRAFAAPSREGQPAGPPSPSPLASGPTLAAATTAPLDARAFHAARRFAATPAGRVAYVERGEGPAALFLHGFPLNGFQWRGAIERLAAVRRCIAPDFLAMGHSEVAAGQSVAPAAQAAMLVGLLEALGVATVDVIANDSGGAVAQLLVARAPERIRSMLLTNCDVEIESPPAAMRDVIALARRGEFADRWLGAWRRDKQLARSPQGIGGMCYADPSQPTDEAIETYFAPLLASPHRKAGLHAYAIALERNPLIGVEYPLGCAKIPTRIVWGTADTIFSPSSADYLDRTLRDSRGVRRLPGGKLFWPEERPDIIAEEAMALWGIARPAAAAPR